MSNPLPQARGVRPTGCSSPAGVGLGGVTGWTGAVTGGTVAAGAGGGVMTFSDHTMISVFTVGTKRIGHTDGVVFVLG